MGTSVPVTSNEIGWFQAAYLIPGTYRVGVELAGFSGQAAVRPGR